MMMTLGSCGDSGRKLWKLTPRWIYEVSRQGRGKTVRRKIDLQLARDRNFSGVRNGPFFFWWRNIRIKMSSGWDGGESVVGIFRSSFRPGMGLFDLFSSSVVNLVDRGTRWLQTDWWWHDFGGRNVAKVGYVLEMWNYTKKYEFSTELNSSLISVSWRLLFFVFIFLPEAIFIN